MRETDEKDSPQRPASTSSADAAPPESEIEGGFVDEIRQPKFDEPRHRALTAQKLALLFAYILSGALATHYVCFMVLAMTGCNEGLESLGRVFNVWLPALTGIVSAAATYYFTREH